MFTKIDERLWSDEKFGLLSNDGKLSFLYVLSCSHRNILGLYKLPIPYGAFDLRWSAERFSKGLDELSVMGLINYDTNTHIVYVKNFLKYNPLENPNQVTGAIKALDTMPETVVNGELVEYLKDIDKPFIKPLLELFKKRLVKQEEVEEEVYVKEEVLSICSKTKKHDTELFEMFYKKYPKKQAKSSALKAWGKIKNLDFDLIMESLEEQKQSDAWRKDNGQYIPMPTTWLNQERWNDEVEVDIKKKSGNPFKDLLEEMKDEQRADGLLDGDNQSGLPRVLLTDK